jgi:hypothetical protein
VNRLSPNLLLKIAVGALAFTSWAIIAYSQVLPAQEMAPDGASTNTKGASTVEPGESSDTADATINPASLLPDLPSLPSKNISLIGGTIEKLDRVRDQITLRIFGGGRMKIHFDPRTHIYSKGGEGQESDLHPGDRVSIDTVLNGSTLFARSIRLKTAVGGESEGLVISYHSNNGELVVRDALSPKPFELRLTSQTLLFEEGQPTSTTRLQPGTLVAVQFDTEQNGRVVARQVSVLAKPGASFTFVGRVTALDLSSGLLTLISATDGGNYEIYLDPSAVPVGDSLHVAADVTVVTTFDGNRYVARNVTVN